MSIAIEESGENVVEAIANRDPAVNVTEPTENRHKQTRQKS